MIEIVPGNGEESHSLGGFSVVSVDLLLVSEGREREGLVVKGSLFR